MISALIKHQNANPVHLSKVNKVIPTYALDTKINPQPLPEFPTLAYCPTSATAVNDVLVNSAIFQVKPLNVTAVDNKQFVESVLQHQRNASLYGYRVCRVAGELPPMKHSNWENPAQMLDYEHYQAEMASAPYGNHYINNAVLEKNSKRRRYMGSSQPAYARACGRERYANESIHPDAPRAMDMDVPTAVPRNDMLRINNQLEGVITVAPGNLS